MRFGKIKMLSVLIISSATCAVMILSILFFPTVKIGKKAIGTYFIVVLIGAAVLLSFGFLSADEVLKGLLNDGAINPIKILILFLSMTAMSIFLDEVGFFRYLAGAALKKSGASQKKLFFILYFTVSLLTLFTSNDIIVLTFTPFICYFAKNAKISPLPYLFAEFVAANTWSMALIIGNPTNIYLATAAGITFIDYFIVMALPTLAGSGVSLVILYLLFRKKLSEPLITAEAVQYKIGDKLLLLFGIVHLAVCTLLIIISAYIKIEMWLITAVFALSLTACVLLSSAIRKKRPRELVNSIKKLPYELIPFVISMFVIVLALEKYGVTAYILSSFGQGLEAFKYGISSYLASNLINNIPMSVLFEAVTHGMPGTAGLSAVYAAVIGSNLGALLTPIGALAGIMWLSILKKLDVKITFKEFINYGAAISIPTLAVALSGLNIMMNVLY